MIAQHIKLVDNFLPEVRMHCTLQSEKQLLIVSTAIQSALIQPLKTITHHAITEIRLTSRPDCRQTQFASKHTEHCKLDHASA